MNMKNNLINRKLLLLTIIYSVVCIILSRHFITFNTIPLNSSKKVISTKIVTAPVYTTTLSNSSSTALLQNNNHLPTPSRGYTERLDANPSKEIKSYNNEDDTPNLNEPDLPNSSYTKKASIKSTENQVINSHLPDYLMYKNVNLKNLNEFLKSKNSLLAEEPYFSTILSVSKDFNLNPLVMFAITGQEQSFVPKNSKNAYKIANNPFNVFNSWQKYNTNIEDTTTIAARTIVNLSKNKPDNIDAFTWVNRKYSEDKNWSKAIRSIFKQLENKVPYLK